MSYPERDQYINLHAHRKASGPHEWVLTSLFAHDYPPDDDPDAAYAVGIHPMHISDQADSDQLKILMLATENCQVLAVGECGLDKRLDIPHELQLEVFRSQVKVAELAGIPVIIHAVKSYSEIIEFLREYKPGIPMVIHGYRGSGQMAGELVKHGCYLSFGSAVLRDKKTAETSAQVPLERLFIETDEDESDIREIYNQIAGIRNLPLEELRSVVHQHTIQLLRR